MKKNLSRILAIVLCLGMMLGLASCFEWDHMVDGEYFETPVVYNGLNNEVVAVTPGVATVDSGSTVSAGGGVATAGGASAASGSSASGSSASGSNAGSSKTSYTDAEALDLYKTAANKVKSTAKSATRTKEVIKTISGSIPSMYQTFGFKEGTKEAVTYGSSDLKDKFPVEKQNYTCNLSASDIKSASVSFSGSNKIVTITVKDDSAGTYDKSKKCVSTISVPIGTWTCKGVQLRGVIDANGRLTSLYYKMPTYVTSGSDAFAFSLEQYWTVSY